jgi:hypothetical protein
MHLIEIEVLTSSLADFRRLPAINCHSTHHIARR